ncbi:hypothetical protein BDZ89DRAFT_1171659 [Hymenopellis radicata]|nr:hypothetical protein BDZ89DRAFT_1171659 [Hymenopellis radicata]
MKKLFRGVGRFLLDTFGDDQHNEARIPPTIKTEPVPNVPPPIVGRLLPIYDTSGQVIGYSTAPPSYTARTSPPPATVPAKSRRKPPDLDDSPSSSQDSRSSTPTSHSSSPLYKRLKNGSFVPIRKVVHSAAKSIKRALSDDESASDHPQRKKPRPSILKSKGGSKRRRLDEDSKDTPSGDGPSLSKKSRPDPSSTPLATDRAHLRFVSRPSPSPPPAPRKDSINIAERPVNSAQLYMKSDRLEVTWDGYPDGELDIDVDYATYEKTNRLMVHWATSVGGGYPQRSADAPDWESGKPSTRKCLRYIKCTNPSCEIVVRPKTRRSARDRQLEETCSCGYFLEYLPCTGQVISYLYSWQGGVHYVNGGFHRHPRPTHEIHLLPKAATEFRKLVMEHPKSGPLKFVVGHQRLDGTFGPSAADISPALLNANRVSYERNKVKRAVNMTGSNFLQQYSAFKSRHAGFVVQEILDSEVVVSLQHPFMQKQLVRDIIRNEAVNGMVSDAAHGWWRVRNELLIVSSSYSPDLSCWVPVLFSFSNGASATHYMWHFFALFKSIGEQGERTGINIALIHFATVVDFSDAERSGFVLAYIRFYQEVKNDPRSKDDLEKEANSLLKGCKEHFRRACIRLSRISLVIPPKDADDFLGLCEKLRVVSDVHEFHRIARIIADRWPRTSTWLAWWMRDSHASMIFKSQVVMDPDIWDLIPGDTNAEEAMHWKLYSGAGRDFDIMHGFEALWAMAAYFERLWEGLKVGGLIRYGKAEPWKVISARIGRTKPTRVPEVPKKRAAINDGRPPDTTSRLARASDKKGKAALEENLSKLAGPGAKETEHKDDPKMTQDKAIAALPGIAWEKNSCWLDASCTAIHSVISWDWTSYAHSVSAHPADSERVFCDIYTFMNAIYTMQELSPSASTRNRLKTKRNEFRAALVHHGLAEPFQVSVDGEETGKFESSFGWLERALLQQRNDDYSSSQSFFHCIECEVRVCAGSVEHQKDHEMEPEHLQVRQPRVTTLIPKNDDAEQHSGSLEDWLQHRVSFHTEGTRCWRCVDGNHLCSGDATRITFFTHLPIVLTLSFSEERPTSLWDIPALLNPLLGASFPAKRGVQYELVSRVFFINKNHFVTHSRRPGRSGLVHVYMHNSNANNGDMIPIEGATTDSHLTGGYVLHPPHSNTGAAVTTEVVYRLRGGQKAQEAILAHQLQQASKDLCLEFSTDSSTQIPEVHSTREGYRQLTAMEISWRKKTWSRKEYEWITAAPTAPRPVLDDLSLPESEEHLEIRKPSPSSVGSLSPGPLESSSPPPPDETRFQCRCGAEGDGNRFELDEIAIHPGKGALVKLGDFWYPARLIQVRRKKWTAKLWRHCYFPANSTCHPGDVIKIDEEYIRDECWNDQKSRRQMRLGRFLVTHRVREALEDRDTNASNVIGFTTEIDKALRPHRQELLALITSPKDVDATAIPALRWLLSKKKQPITASVPYNGGIALDDWSRVDHWFSKYFGADNRIHWVSLIPMAHAGTILLATRMSQPGQDWGAALDAAWDHQVSYTGKTLNGEDRFHPVDVDLEAISMLEDRMFSRSNAAGIAGNCQWGLDAGHHQEGWSPYQDEVDRPSWTDDLRTGSESELVLGKNFVHLTKRGETPLKQVAVPAKPRPKPRPTRKKSKQSTK